MESISTRLQGIFNELELIDDPRRDPIRIVLQGCISDVLSFETNFGFPDLVKQCEGLKKELEAYKLVKEDELDAHKTESREQINALAERLEEASKKVATSDQKPANAPQSCSEKGFTILNCLETASGTHQTVDDIAGKCLMTPAQVTIELDTIKELVQCTYPLIGGKHVMVVHRTIAGDKYVVEHWGKQEDALPGIQERILLLLSRAYMRSMDEHVIHGALCAVGEKLSFEDLLGHLNELKGKNHVHRDPLPLKPGAGYEWILGSNGTIYLGKRRMLDDPLIRPRDPIPVVQNGVNSTEDIWDKILLFLLSPQYRGGKFKSIAQHIGASEIATEVYMEDLEAEVFVIKHFDSGHWAGVFTVTLQGKRYLAKRGKV